ncbi:MAG: ATP-binding protein [Anaerolineae bacterium]
MSQRTVPSFTIDGILSSLAEQLPRLISVTCCRAGLLDESQEYFTIRAAHAVRDFPWNPHVGNTLLLDEVPRLRQAVDAGQPLVLSSEDVRRLAVMGQAYPLLDRGLRSLAAIPLATRQRVLGLISLGEMRSWDRSPITTHKLDTCSAIASQTAISVEKAVELRALRARQQMLEHLLGQAMADFLIVIDSRRRITFANAAVERLLGRPRGEIVGRPCTEVFEACNGEHCLLALAMQSCRVVPPREVSGCTISPNDRQPYLIGAAAPVIGRTGQVEGGVGLFWDPSASRITTLSQETLLSALIHELRAPLTNLKLAANAALRYTQRDEQTEALLQTLNLQCDRLSAAVYLLLDTRWGNSHDQEILPQPVNLAQAIARAVALYKGFASSHPIHVQIKDDATWALADEAYMMVILCDLLDNAIKYSPEGGVINVDVDEYDEDSVVITITDQGVGIPGEHLDRIFREFYRVQGDHVPPVDGKGQGLYIVKRLLEAQNGQIWVESQPGKGTSFTLTLPRLRPTAATD